MDNSQADPVTAETTMKEVIGKVLGYAEGALFANRREAFNAGVHRQIQAGIAGHEASGAESIVVSGGYEDDEDSGDTIVYTGQGGNDPNTRKQIADQELRRGNLALAKSCTEGLPVRVIRGAGGDPHHSPTTGFRYDGLYYVQDFWQDTGKSGYRIWRFRLVREPDEPISPPQLAVSPMARREVFVQRLVRNTTTVSHVKSLYNHSCQICELQIETPIGPYAEGTHIRPMGRPHDGPDVAENILCLCPNDHVRFIYGELVIEDNLCIVDRSGRIVGTLRVAPGHSIGQEFLKYHRMHYRPDRVAP